MSWKALILYYYYYSAAVVSETVRQQILDRQRRMAAAEDAPEMSKPQTAALQRDIAAILLPGESVTKALQRLGKQDKRPAGVCSHSMTALFSSVHTVLSIGPSQVQAIVLAFFQLACSGQLYTTPMHWPEQTDPVYHSSPCFPLI